MKIIKYLLIASIFIITTGCQIKSDETAQIKVILPIQSKTYSGSTEICPGVKMIYDRGYYGSEIQYCTSSSGEQYLMIERYGVEGGSGRIFFDLQGNELGKIEQYAEGDGTLPRFPWSSGKIFDGSCTMVDLKSCNIIDLVGSYWGKNGLLTGSKYAQTCVQTFKKLGLQTEGTSDAAYEKAYSYMMCTDDHDIFYIGFTGTKIGNNRLAPYQNYRTIQFYTLEGEELGYTSKFIMKTDGDLLKSIDILGNDSDKDIYSIDRCIYVPIGDCYWKIEDEQSPITDWSGDLLSNL